MKPEVAIGLLLLAAGLVLLVVYACLRVQAKERAAGCRPLAERLRAQLLLFPREPGMVGLRWERRGVRYLLKFGRGRVELRARPPEAVLSRLRVRWESEPGSPFRIRVVEQEQGRPLDVLTERVWDNLETIARMGRPSGGSVETTPEEAVLRKPVGLKDDDALQLFVRLSMPVLTRAIKLCTVTGVEILEAASTGEGDCPVCGHALGEDAVRCAKCRTPHHKDCWEYLGACATYACGEARHA
jgi:predicted RNA-binding Zn-ribbon protein involved in translation (DUF1610 family)